MGKDVIFGVLHGGEDYDCDWLNQPEGAVNYRNSQYTNIRDMWIIKYFFLDKVDDVIVEGYYLY